jgi:tRNA(fMet)-specific endonuclease VapC
MLDTNAISEMVRKPDGAVVLRAKSVGRAALCTSAIVASELRYGLKKKGAAGLEQRVESALEKIPILPYDALASSAYAGARHALEKIGQPIGYTDLFIAAHALSLSLTLVTANIREFSRVDGLAVENWAETS